MVLVQGTARRRRPDLDANRERYEREMAEKPRPLHALAPTGALQAASSSWYYDRIYLHVRPERVYVWAGAAARRRADPVRRARRGSALGPQPGARGRATCPRRAGLGRLGHLDWTRLGREATPRRCSRSSAPTASRSRSASPSMPERRRVRRARRRRTRSAHRSTPGPACLCAHAHAEDLHLAHSYQVRGDLVEQDGRLVLHPHRVVAGLQAAVVGVRALPRQRAQDPALPQDGPRARAGPRERRRGDATPRPARRPPGLRR